MKAKPAVRLALDGLPGATEPLEREEFAIFTEDECHFGPCGWFE